MLRELGEEDDLLLRGGQLAGLLRMDVKDGQGKSGLARMTVGWKWAHEYKKGLTNKVVRVDQNTPNYTTIAKEHNLGEVVQLVGVNNSSKITNPPKEKIVEKLEERKHPSKKTWDEKTKIMTTCYFLEERQGDFFCDCFEGIKSRMCKHCGHALPAENWKASSDRGCQVPPNQLQTSLSAAKEACLV